MLFANSSTGTARNLASRSTTGPLLRSINKAGRIWGHGFTPKVIWAIVKANAKSCGLPTVAPRDLRRYAPAYAILPAANWIKSNSCSGTFRSRPQNDTSAASRSCRTPSMTGLASSQMRTADRNPGWAADQPPLSRICLRCAHQAAAIQSVMARGAADTLISTSCDVRMYR